MFEEFITPRNRHERRKQKKTAKRIYPCPGCGKKKLTQLDLQGESHMISVEVPGSDPQVYQTYLCKQCVDTLPRGHHDEAPAY